ncbi:hypothetical protein GCM10009554_24970 [Kribbella koreensis]|uniref:Uncharacterized protein n=2 Tax=Kribbella TaxID=182639 RepID=A0ABP6W266_9ACTN
MDALGNERYRAAFERGAAACTGFGEAMELTVGREAAVPVLRPASTGPDR